MSRQTTLRMLAICVATLGTSAQALSADPDRLTLSYKGTTAKEAAVRIDVTGQLAPGTYQLAPSEAASKTSPFPMQVRREGDHAFGYAVIPDLLAGETHLVASPITGEGPGVVFVESPAKLDIQVGGKPFTSYRVDSGPKPILYPLIGVDGLAYSRSFPMEKKAGEDQDHPHQRSLWFTYGQVNGVDFWAELKGHGSIKETSRSVEGSGHSAKILRTTDNWLDASGKKLMEDERTLTIWNTTNKRVIDLEVILKATEGPVEFGDTKEGMFGVRVPSSMDVKAKTGGKIVNAEGLTDGAAWGKKSPWVDYSGPVEGKTVGITILDHPESFGHPTPWHVRDYGLFAANPFGKHDFGLTRASSPTTLAKGQSLRFVYRVVLHQGDASKSDPKAEFELFSTPPTISSRRQN